jgi:ketosteroid isomerase-like protein
MCVRTVKVSANDQAAQIMAIEERWIQAIARCDVPALNALAGDEFTMVCDDGSVLQRDRAILDGRLCVEGAPDITIDSIDIRLYGRTAIVIGRRVLDYAGGRERVLLRFMNVIVQRDQRWQLVAEELTAIG